MILKALILVSIIDHIKARSLYTSVPDNDCLVYTISHSFLSYASLIILFGLCCCNSSQIVLANLCFSLLLAETSLDE